MAIWTALAALTGWIAAGLGPAGLGLSVAAAAAGANLIVGTGLSVLSSALMRKKVSNPSIEYQAVSNQATGDRPRGYGWYMPGGIRAFFDCKDGTLDQIVMLHTGRIESIEAIYLGDRRVELNADGVVEGYPYNSHVEIHQRLGYAVSAVYDEMVDTWGWTEDHNLDGIATLFVRFKSPDISDFSRLFPEGINTPVRAICKLSRVDDPRTGVFEWSDNPSCCLMNYLTHQDGYRLEGADIDRESFADFADVCDQWIPLKSGKVERRYRLGGMYSLQDNPKDVLVRMLATCDAELFTTSKGQIGIRGGVWTDPEVTIEDKHILSFEFEDGSDKFAAFNSLKVLYTDPFQDYQLTEASRWTDFAAQAERGVMAEEFEVDMVQSPNQARRLAKIFYHKQNPRWRGTITTDLVGLMALGERIIRVVLPEMAIDQTFLVESHAISGDLSTCTIGLIALGPEAYAWNADEEEGESVAPLPEPPPLGTVPVPTGLAVRTEERLITTATTARVIVATVNPPGRAGLALDAQHRLLPDGDWESMAAPETSFTARSGVVIDSETYEVRARFRTGSASASAWTETVEIQISA